METLYLIVSIAGQRVAIAAEPVESVVKIDAITPIPLVPPHIAGLAALRSRVLTVVDTWRSLGIGTSPRVGALRAVIVAVDAHHYGVLVDDVVDVVAIGGPPHPNNLVLAPGWARAVRGILNHAGEALLLLDPAALVTGPPLAIAA